MHLVGGYGSLVSTANERLKQARVAKGFETATDAANALGVPVPTYTQHENGRRGFPAKRAPAYARAFGVTTDWLLYGKGSRASIDDRLKALQDMFDVDAEAAQKLEELGDLLSRRRSG